MPTDAELLDFERRHERHNSHKEMLIPDELGLRPARYYQLLQRVVRTPEAWAADPMLCRRVLDRTAA
ncbi:DUF3263 domain-containing protein [Microbacterium sp. BH-3-3-3]|uniref:DUF3263 domain-containing protein n=1 Tax=Microbacterium sp. BH-3-3-3 TaxID=1906742 RepID=UPI00119C9581|nr:DUF3263 domain-containing protein [Microbacterium sp. BH-3-3-3]